MSLPDVSPADARKPIDRRAIGAHTRMRACHLARCADAGGCIFDGGIAACKKTEPWASP